jgi:hypothetical protein
MAASQCGEWPITHRPKEEERKQGVDDALSLSVGKNETISNPNERIESRKADSTDSALE